MKYVIGIMMLLASVAYAEKVQPIVITGPDSMDPYEVELVILQARDQFLIARGPKVKLLPAVVYEDPLPHLDGIQNQEQRLNALTEHFKALGFKSKKVFYHLILPPIHEGGKLAIAGLSRTCQYKKANYSMSNASLYNHQGDDRILHSTFAMVHELAHAFGAKHLPGRNIMDPNALALVDELGFNLDFDRKSINQMKRCKRRSMKRKKRKNRRR